MNAIGAPFAASTVDAHPAHNAKAAAANNFLILGAMSVRNCQAFCLRLNNTKQCGAAVAYSITAHSKESDEGVRFDATSKGIGAVKLLQVGGRHTPATASQIARRRGASGGQ
jgi:hypothetical protein